jgi:multimeric flavodoxin WrbA
MPTLLVVHHTVSPAMQELFDAALSGTSAEGLESVEVVVRAALAAGPPDVLAADGFLLGTPANIGYLSGAMKYFFDNVYYPCQTAKIDAPYGLYVHGNNSVEGAVRAAESIAKGMGWRRATDPVLVTGEITADVRDAVWNLGATVAAHLAGLA